MAIYPLAISQAVVPKTWSLGQLHQHHLETFCKYKISISPRHIRLETLGVKPRNSCLTSPPMAQRNANKWESPTKGDASKKD